MRDAFVLRKVVSKSSLGTYERWHARFFDLESGKEIAQRSVDLLARKLKMEMPKGKMMKERDAQRICALAIENGLVLTKQTCATFIAYAVEFWNFDGDRIRRKNRRVADSINMDHAKNMAKNITKHVAPRLPKNLLLEKVTARHINGVADKLIDAGELSNATIAKIIQSMTTPLRDAYRKGLIPVDPTLKVENLSTKSDRPRGILTQSELQLVVSEMSKRTNVHSYLAVVLSAATAMRQGEILALRAEHIQMVNDIDAIVTIESAFAKVAEFKSPKGKRVRYVPLARGIAEALISFSNRNLHKNGLVFWSMTSKTRPISAGYLNEGFYSVLWDIFEDADGVKRGTMAEIGVDEDGEKIEIRRGEQIRRERNVVFHSLRHFCVSSLRGTVNDTALRLAIGHEDEATTDGYTHTVYDNLKGIADATRGLLRFEPIKVEDAKEL